MGDVTPVNEMMDRLSSTYYEALRRQIAGEGGKLQLFTPFRPLGAGADDPDGDRRLAILMDGRPQKSLVVAQDQGEGPSAPTPARAPAAAARAAPRGAHHLTGGYYAVYGTMLSHLKAPAGPDKWVETLKSEKAPTEENKDATEFGKWQAFLSDARKTDKTSATGELLQSFLEVTPPCN
jgi:hypothetical protein